MKKIKFVTMYKGGGGGGTTTVESVPGWARPYIENSMIEVGKRYEEGALNRVAGTSDLQYKAFTTGANDLMNSAAASRANLGTASSALSEIAKQGINFQGGEALKQGATRQAGKDIAGLSTQYGSAGTLGSARQANANANVQTDLAAKFANIDYDIAKSDAAARAGAAGAMANVASTDANIAQGTASSLANLGGQQRTIDQQLNDSDWQAINRYASTIYGTPAKQTAVASPGGK